MKHLPEDFIKNLLLDKISDIVMVTDAQGKTLWANKSFTDLTGYTLEEVYGQPPGRVLQGRDSDPETVDYMRKAIREGKPFKANVMNYSKSGRKYWLNIDAKPVFDPKTHELKYFIAVERDITLTVQSKQEEVNNYLLQLQQAAEEREKLIRSISMLSHDLKSPINRILGLLPLIDTSQLSKIEQETMSFIQKECIRLKKLTEKILSAQKGEKDVEVDLQWLDVNQLIRDLINAFSYETKRKNQRIEFDSPHFKLEAKLDYILLNQVLENLFSNAIKYTPVGKKISFKTQEEGEHIMITIQDEGTGISKWKQKHLFSPFQTLSNTHQKQTSSSGMGLFIVKKYVNLLDGNIQIKSEEGSGTTFKLKFWKNAEESFKREDKAA